jgi:2-haloacid dehalogenase
VARFLARSGLDAIVETPRDVTAAGAWKPVAAAYRWICSDVGVEPVDAAMVAVHPWDVAGAMRTGMRGAWLDRDGARWPGFLPGPDHAAASMDALAAALLADDG